MDIQKKLSEHREMIFKRTCTIKELAEMLNISEKKAREICRIEGCPIITIGRNKRILLNRLDHFLEGLIGEVIH